MFKIEAIGNLGGDAEVKNDNGRLYVQFSVADTRKFVKEDGTKQEVTNWISCFYRNAEAEIIKYLKKGTRVFVRGYGDLRLFSSAKDRMMKAGCSINVQEIELVGGSSDEIPRQLALASGQLFDVHKAYFIDVSGIPEGQRPKEVFDKRGVVYECNEYGYITAVKNEKPEQTESSGTNTEGSTENSGTSTEGSTESSETNADGSPAEVF